MEETARRGASCVCGLHGGDAIKAARGTYDWQTTMYGQLMRFEIVLCSRKRPIRAGVPLVSTVLFQIFECLRVPAQKIGEHSQQA